MVLAAVSEDGVVDETGGKVKAMVGKNISRRRSWLGLVGIVVGIKTIGNILIWKWVIRGTRILLGTMLVVARMIMVCDSLPRFTHQIKSLQWQQKVGCLKNLGENL